VIVFRTFDCSCGYTGWAVDDLYIVICRKCGKEVKTEEIIVNEDVLKDVKKVDGGGKGGRR
jgi:hypothetical protein